MSRKNNFDKYELLNIQLDIWIDEEDYKEIYSHITPSVNVPPDDKKFIKNFQKFLSEKSPITSIKINENEEEFDSCWQPLFWAKYLRAKIMENGTDDVTELLDDLVLYLQRKLPPPDKNNLLLQHLYLQELSACGKPGLESLGFALQAESVLKKINKDTTLYKLWAKLNQGMGYAHSKQMMEAIQAYDEIIKTFPEDFKNNRDWQHLIYDQAVLFKAEALEELQFSYHTLITLNTLNDRKKERRLVKEALAYRDMCRLGEAKDKMEELWEKFESVDDAFTKYDTWQKAQERRGKKNITSQAFGLLIDYYLMKFEEEWDDKNQNNNDEILKFTNELKKYIKDLPEFLKNNKKEKMSFYCQIARFLSWLCKKEISQAKKLYLESREDINKITVEDLRKFSKYEYDTFAESLEEFYKEINKEGDSSFKDDEINFLDELKKFEEEKDILFKFKELERKLRIERLKKGHKNNKNCLDCFHAKRDKKAFRGILDCAKKSSDKDAKSGYAFGMKTMQAKDYEAVMKYENAQFLNHLEFKSKHPNPGLKEESYHFMGLQRWNSQTPALALSKGGGYFIYKQDETGKVTLGIAIDPGFDFIDNLFHMGFTLNDIDFILISHAHLDHMRDFEPIISLLLDLKKRDKGKKKIHVMMTLGVYDKLQHVITNSTLREYLADTYIVDIDKERMQDKSFRFKSKNSKKANDKGDKSNGNKNYVSLLPDTKKDDNEWENEWEIEIKPTEAYHNDFSEISDSFGYIVKFREHGDEIISIGYTGDTKWNGGNINGYKGILEQYRDCDMICIHLGALIRSEKEEEFAKYSKAEECENLIENKGHLYLFGLLRFLKEIKKQESKGKIILISEFGEELKGAIRIDLIQRLNKIVQDNGHICLPVDIGLNVMLAKIKKINNNSSKAEFNKVKDVWCTGCESFVEAGKIGYKHFGYGRDEALFYFCKTCLKSKPENVIQEKMRSICEFGIPLQKAE